MFQMRTLHGDERDQEMVVTDGEIRIWKEAEMHPCSTLVCACVDRGKQGTSRACLFCPSVQIVYRIYLTMIFQ